MSTRRSDESILVIGVLVILLLVGLPMLMMVFVPMGWGMMGWGGYGGGSAVSPIRWVFVTVPVLVILLGGAYLLYRTIRADSSDGDRALEELRLAYARGDLTDEEYETRRRRLEDAEQ